MAKIIRLGPDDFKGRRKEDDDKTPANEPREVIKFKREEDGRELPKLGGDTGLDGLSGLLSGFGELRISFGSGTLEHEIGASEDEIKRVIKTSPAVIGRSENIRVQREMGSWDALEVVKFLREAGPQDIKAHPAYYVALYRQAQLNNQRDTEAMLRDTIQDITVEKEEEEENGVDDAGEQP